MGFNIEFVLYDQCISKHISTLQYDLCLLFKLLTRTPVTIALGGIEMFQCLHSGSWCYFEFVYLSLFIGKLGTNLPY